MLPLEVLEERINYKFENKALLKRAVTHRSFSMEHNERLEFLGDSVLNCVIGNALFMIGKHFDEGSLSRIRSNLVRQSALVEISERIGIKDFLKTGEGEHHNPGGLRPSICADAVEAIFGAIFTDSGFNEAQTVIIRLYEPMLNRLTPETLGKDPKTNLQEKLQSKHLALPQYEVVEVSGPDHNQMFTVRVIVPGLDITEIGLGKSRRQAEQDAAHKALCNEAIIKL